MPDRNFGRKILVIDETLREGMQFHGLVFSLKQRIKILQFQEALGIDICQIGYPSAHPWEAKTVSQVAAHAKKNGFKIRTAALGRAFMADATIVCDTGIDDPHFHLQIKNTITDKALTRLFQDLETTINLVRARRPGAMISIAMLDIGKTDPSLLIRCVRALSQDLKIDILSLPDTSGIMAPNQVYDRIKDLSGSISKAKLAIHCHNDMGMASANSIMGILAGASVLEVSALGIGERNGIGDLFTTTRQLKGQGMNLRVDTDNLDLFRQYYGYLDTIVAEQTGHNLIQYNTPVFGEAMGTHVAGTHAQGEFGALPEENFYLNLLCGRHLVQKYLNLNDIPHDEKKLHEITTIIKTLSINLERCLEKDEIRLIAMSVC
ncbi:MAG: hypothetical protein GY710_04110 [Desulfobacteraceae bacterium]|nr:hypothetical protein [Desulfobacteraceae bacterium]